jgi:hypothetical protein
MSIGFLPMRWALGIVVIGVLVLAGCGSDGGDSGYTEDEIASALNLRFEGADNLYATPDGDCIVTQVLTSSDEVEEADTGELSEAVATTPEGDAGVTFGGFTSVDPDTCASYAETDLARLAK